MREPFSLFCLTFFETATKRALALFTHEKTARPSYTELEGILIENDNLSSKSETKLMQRNPFLPAWLKRENKTGSRIGVKGSLKRDRRFFLSLFLFPLLNIILLWGGKGGNVE